MYIHDEADMGTVVTETAKTLLEAGRHIGRADRALSAEQIAQLETAIKELQRSIAGVGVAGATR